jgi:hypothetical protein
VTGPGGSTANTKRRPSGGPRGGCPIRRSARQSGCWHGHRRRAGTVIMERRISGLVRGGGPGVDWRLPSSGGRGAGPSGLDGVRAVEQRLAAQRLGDFGGFADGGPAASVSPCAARCSAWPSSPWARRPWRRPPWWLLRLGRIRPACLPVRVASFPGTFLTAGRGARKVPAADSGQLVAAVTEVPGFRGRGRARLPGRGNESKRLIEGSRFRCFRVLWLACSRGDHVA